MPNRRPTIYDVARAAGVSKSLVSLVLNGSDKVAAGSRRAVEEAITALDYRPRRAAADLATSRSHVIGVLIDDYSNPWFVDVLSGLAEVLAPHGYRFWVVDAVSSGAQDPLDALRSLGADALVVGRDVPPTALAAVREPVVVVGSRTHVPDGVALVADDDAAGVALAVAHLRGLGHAHLAHLSASGGAGSVRAASFAAEAPRGVVHSCGEATGTEAGGYRAGLALLRDHPEVTGIVAANDVVAIGALGAARELGRRVPQDLSVVGYDDTDLGGARLVDLTTVDDRSREVGVEAGKVLLARLAPESGHHPPDVAEPILLSPRLVVRGTTAGR